MSDTGNTGNVTFGTVSALSWFSFSKKWLYLLNSLCLDTTSCMRCGRLTRSLPTLSSKHHNHHQTPESDTENIYACDCFMNIRSLSVPEQFDPSVDWINLSSTDRSKAPSIAEILWVVDRVVQLYHLIWNLTAGYPPGLRQHLKYPQEAIVSVCWSICWIGFTKRKKIFILNWTSW